MQKILIMNNEMGVGGTEKVLLTLLKYIDKTKFDVTLLLLAPGDEWENLIPKEVKIKYIFRKNPQSYNKVYKLLYRYCIIFGPSSLIRKLIFNETYETYDTCIAFKECMIDYLVDKNAKNYCWIHQDYANEEKSKGLIKNLLKHKIEHVRRKKFMKCEKIVCVSETCKISFLNKYQIPREKVLCRYNPNDVDEIRKLGNEKIGRKIDIDVPIMCAVGRVEPVKAYDRLINIAKKLKEEKIDFRLIIVGNGSLYNDILEMVKTYNLEDIVWLTGFQSNPYKYISKSDLLVCSSISEAFSTVATEAIILGIPVITTLCAGMEELLGDKSGLITRNDEESLYIGIKKVLTDKKILKDMKEAANKRKNDFVTQVTVKKIEELFVK